MGSEEKLVVFWKPARTILIKCSCIYGEHLLTWTSLCGVSREETELALRAKNKSVSFVRKDVNDIR
jgi:hypothetical protein